MEKQIYLRRLHIHRPIVRHGLLEYTPLIWNGEDFQENRFFWEEALHHGIRHGWSIPVRGKYG